MYTILICISTWSNQRGEGVGATFNQQFSHTERLHVNVHVTYMYMHHAKHMVKLEGGGGGRRERGGNTQPPTAKVRDTNKIKSPLSYRTQSPFVQDVSLTIYEVNPISGT